MFVDATPILADNCRHIPLYLVMFVDATPILAAVSVIANVTCVVLTIVVIYLCILLCL